MAALEPDKHKSRGLEMLVSRFANLTKEIKRRIQPNRQLRILEVGCGYGVALLELCRRYGDRLKLFGISMIPDHGDAATMKRMAVSLGLCAEEEKTDLVLPEIYYFDVCKLGKACKASTGAKHLDDKIQIDIKLSL